MRAIVVLTLTLAASAAWAGSALAQTDGATKPSSRGAADAAPSLTLPDLAGAEQSLASYKGRIVVLNFWATSCLPCRKETAEFVALQSEYAAWGVDVVGVSIDDAAARGEVVKFVREQKVTYTVWTGGTAADLERFGVGPTPPATVILDAEGRVVARFGAVHIRDVRKRVEGLVAARRAAAGGLARAEAPAVKKGAAPVPARPV
jgi:peroxiredoxin